MLYDELIQEEGYVKKVENGIAIIKIISQTNCDTCEAKIFCSANNEEEKIAYALDPFGVKPGDRVRIEAKGTKVLKFVFFLYGIPLIIFLVSIFIGFVIFKNYTELYSFLLALFLMAIYFSVFFITRKKLIRKNPDKYYPKIIFVSSSTT